MERDPQSAAGTGRPRQLIWALAVILSCSDPGRVCTLIGCQSGLTVALTSQPAGAYSVEVYTTGDGPRFVHQCSGTGTCQIFFPSFTPSHVFVDVVVGSATATHERNVTYTVSRPNGPGCDPECRQATVTVSPP
jgi:hypothetical protein